MIGANAGSSVFEFLAIRGRTYSIRASADLSHWTAVDSACPARGPRQRSFKRTWLPMCAIEGGSSELGAGWGVPLFQGPRSVVKRP